MEDLIAGIISKYGLVGLGFLASIAANIYQFRRLTKVEDARVQEARDFIEHSAKVQLDHKELVSRLMELLGRRG